MPMKIKDVMVSDDDLNQRFRGAYIEIRKKEEAPEIVIPQEIVLGQLFLLGADPISLKDITIVREFPSLGSVQFKEDVHFLRRKTERQWSRGLRSKVVSDYTRSRSFSYEKTITPDMARAIFYPAFQTLESGITHLYSGRLNSFAYNQEFWFSGFKKRIYLWFKDVPIGEIQSSTLFCFPECHHLKQEVKDEFGNGLAVK